MGSRGGKIRTSSVGVGGHRIEAGLCSSMFISPPSGYEEPRRDHRVRSSWKAGRDLSPDHHVDAFDTLHRHAGSPDLIIPGHDPLVMQRYPSPSPELQGIVARLDVPPVK